MHHPDVELVHCSTLNSIRRIAALSSNIDLAKYSMLHVTIACRLLARRRFKPISLTVYAEGKYKQTPLIVDA
jgi:hypothetical protein